MSLEEIKQKKLEEMQSQQAAAMQKEAAEQQQLQNQVQEMENVVKKFLSKEALERYGNLKVGHEDKAMKVLLALAQVVQAGQLQKQLSDAEFKDILQKLEPKKKEFTIKRV